MKFYIYKVINKLNGKMYIGVTKYPKRRKQEHWKCGYSDKIVKYLYSSIRKYGSDNFEFSIIESFSSDKKAFKSEMKWIKHFESNNRLYGYNASKGGESGHHGCKHSSEAKAKMSKDRIGESNSQSKLTDKIVLKLREECSKSTDHNFIKDNAYNLNVTEGCLYGAISGKSWKHLPLSSKRKIPVSIATRNKMSKSKIGHTNSLGSKNNMAKLTENNVVEIKTKYQRKPTIETKKQLAKKFNTKLANITQILSGRRWAHITI